jgi:DNA replication and repair protein RecF
VIAKNPSPGTSLRLVPPSPTRGEGNSPLGEADHSTGPADSVEPRAARIRRLTLSNFRSYRAAQISPERELSVLLGANGAGKTNLLEAISFLAPGRGLRRATREDVAFAEGDGSWAAAAEVEGALGLATLGTGAEPPSAETESRTRQCRVDREPVASAAAFADHLRVVWLVPAMDQLFAGPASERRRFLDRLVLAVDAGHGSRVAALERSLRSRNRLLEEKTPDPHWLDAVERETAELAVAVAAARVETMRRLAAALARRREQASAFPWASIALSGSVENALEAAPASEVEDRYRAELKQNRARDAAAGRTLDGPHLTDLDVVHGPKGIAAGETSTGEQKALLIDLVLAHAGLIAQMTSFSPVLLLDEVVAHLDPKRRTALFEALETLGAQVFLSGADPAAFAEVMVRAQVFAISPGRIEPWR